MRRVVLRPRTKTRRIFVGMVVAGTLAPSAIAIQDIGLETVREAHAPTGMPRLASAVVVVQGATRHLPDIVGKALPDFITDRIVKASVVDDDITGSLASKFESFLTDGLSAPLLSYPTPNRAGKGDRLVPARKAAEQPAAEAEASEDDLYTPMQYPGADEPEEGGSLAEGGTIRLGSDPAEAAGDLRDVRLPPELESSGLALVRGRQTDGQQGPTFVLNTERFGDEVERLEPWAPGEQPIVLAHVGPAEPVLRDEPFREPDIALKRGDPDGGASVASKGVVTGEGRRPRTPHELLELTAATRPKAEKCLANAIYFEARSEPERGQVGVAQVVLNRAFSGYYPDDVCGVVYQNARRYMSCQFTFACDGIRDVVTDKESWARATRIARDALDGRVWSPEIGKATHYHAAYVHPYWARSMRKLHRVGLHTFYRPRKWGDGADAPSWGPTVLASAKTGS